MEPSYAVRVGLWAGETAYRQTDHELVWQNARGRGCISYRQISDIQVYKIRYFGSRRSYWRCVLSDQAKNTVVLQAAHRLGLRRIEDRTPTYIPFIKQLESRIRAANPDVTFRSGQNWLSAWDSVTGILLVASLRAARILSYEKSAAIGSTLLRTIGPHLKGHGIARANLTAAFPEKSEADIEKILSGMWDGLGRVIAEYAHLGRVWDFDRSGRTSGRIVMDETNKSRYLAMRVTKGPAMIFGAHLANWEMLCWALGTSDAETAVVYRPPKISSVDRELATLRSGSKVQYIPADVNGPFKLMNVMRREGWIGLLVDEPDPRGMKVKFFGRECSAKPLFAKIARQFDCPIYGARTIRQPDGKLALDLTGPVSLPRDASGKIDVPAATQFITDIIEGWIREYPEQWLWLQRRWR
jgi:KDO2-lipid IV(A) lauroyltransferase